MSMHPTSAPADLVILAQSLHTMDPEAPSATATAIAVSGGFIRAVGTHAEIRDLIGSRTRVIDEPGLVVTPGLVDGHQHQLLGLDQGRGIDLSDAADPTEVRALLRAEAERLGPDEWIIGYGLDYNLFVERPMHREVIDDATGGHPAWLWLADVHTALMNSRGLYLAGITGAEVFADHGEVVCDPDGTPTGELHEMSAILHGFAAVPAPGPAETGRRLAEMQAEQNRCGLTGAHIFDLWPGTEQVLDHLAETDRLTMRLRVAPWILAGQVDDSVAAAADLAARTAGPERLWSAGAVKLFLDGAVDGGSAWLDHPDCHGESTRAQWLDPEQYADACATAVAAGLSCWTHAIGDAAVRFALDTYGTVGVPAGGRHRIEHIEILDDADVRRFAELGVVASMQPTHMDWSKPDHSDNWSERLGPDRCARAWRYRDLADAGATLAFGSDWPIAHFDPREVMAGARLRRPVGEPDRLPYGADQALDATRALLAYTRGAALAAGEDSVAGRLRPGYRADLTVFGADPLTTPAQNLPDLPVAATVVAGRVVYARDSLA